MKTAREYNFDYCKCDVLRTRYFGELKYELYTVNTCGFINYYIGNFFRDGRSWSFVNSNELTKKEFDYLLRCSSSVFIKIYG